MFSSASRIRRYAVATMTRGTTASSRWSVLRGARFQDAPLQGLLLMIGACAMAGKGA